MRSFSVASTAVMVAVVIFLNNVLDGVTALACAAGTAEEIAGNWYCSDVRAITYTNFPGHGSYNKITNMDASSGTCSSVRYNYSGSLAPLNEELSLHIRGPTWLKQVAIYMPDTVTTANKKRTNKASFHDRNHGGHQYLHNRHGNVKEIQQDNLVNRAAAELISATIDGQLASWTNMYTGPGPSLATDTAAALVMMAVSDDSNTSTPETTMEVDAQNPTISSSSAALPSATSSQGRSGNWARQAYYNAASGTAEGITILNHFGGTDGIPGTSAGGPAFGVSLSYASPNGQSGAASPQILSNTMIEDDTEVIIMSNRSCEDGGCGYTRPGGVAYHGFSGSEKLFLLEFSMPITNSSAFNGDMPAIWLLNAQIPLTSQYGNPDCSCWTSGCGEFDLFEVLDHGDFRCKSTLHMAPAGGSSDWFARPSSDSIIAAVVIAGANEEAAIRVLDEGQSFNEILNGSVVNGWVKEQSSVFALES